MIILMHEFIRLVFLSHLLLFHLLCLIYLTIGLGMLCSLGNHVSIFIFNSISYGMIREDVSFLMRLMNLFT